MLMPRCLGSTFLGFEDVRVPFENLLGKEDRGFPMIMSNFNPERVHLACASLRLSRVCAQDAYAYACQRETFGRPLIEHAPIRSKIATFGLLIEPVHAFLEQLVFVVESSRGSGKRLNVGGMTALLKVMSTRCLEKVCREAQQILGGAAYSKSGKGARIEQISRDVRVYAVGGGSEEIMLDLAVRQEARDFRLRAEKHCLPKL
jgi:alkylation response protein AidB-like acyl-CoA dehydrogenase